MLRCFNTKIHCVETQQLHPEKDRALEANHQNIDAVAEPTLGQRLDAQTKSWCGVQIAAQTIQRILAAAMDGPLTGAQRYELQREAMVAQELARQSDLGALYLPPEEYERHDREYARQLLQNVV